MHKTDESKASEIYSDGNTQALLRKFTSGEIDVLEPFYDPKTGYRYPVVEEIVGDNSLVTPTLNKLCEEKFFEKKLYDKVIYCPHCGLARVSFRYCCPFCKSFNIHKSSMIEHIRCGYIGLEENFNKNTLLACPKCHENLKQINVDYLKASVWCACKDCRKSFDIPVPEHYCTNCHMTSNFEDATIKDIYSYTLSEQIREKLSSHIFLVTPIMESLTQAGFNVESPALLKGKSGAQHSFDIAAFKEIPSQGLVVIDLSISRESMISEQPVIALFAKTFDISPEKVFLIAIPKLNDNGQKMAELYNIDVIEARNQAEALALLRDKLEK